MGKRLDAVMHNAVTAWVVLGVSLLLTVLGWYVANVYVEQRAADRFRFEVDEARQRISLRMLEYEHMLRGGLALFRASDEVTRADWHVFVSTLRIRQYFPGIQGMGYAVMVAATERAAHERAVRAEGFPDYRVHPQGARDPYSAIVYLEPFRGRNLRAFGFDMYSEPVRRAAMERARDTALPAVSGRVTLIQEDGQDVQAGFIMYLPLYRKGMAMDSAPARRAALAGFIYSPFRTVDLMRGILGAGPVGLDFKLYDGELTRPEHLLYDSTRAEPPQYGRESHAPRHTALTRIELPGRVWTARFGSRPGFEEATSSQLPALVASGGLLVDGLLFGIILSLTRQKQRLAEKAAALEASEAAHQQESQARRLAEATAQQVLASAPVAMLGVRPSGRISFANAAAERLFAAQPGQLLERPVEDLLPESLRDWHATSRRAYAAAPTARAMGEGRDLHARRLDGAEVAVEIGLAPIDTAQGRVILANIVDISGRRRAQGQIEAALKEKTLLLNEVHHRVKNNLQIVASLLSLQGGQAGDPALAALIAESEGRVRAMALMHELLYEHQDFARVELDSYLRRLAGLLAQIHGAAGRGIEVRVEARPLALDLTRAIPLGLIVNELLTNAFKHAFPDGGGGQVGVDLSGAPGDEARLTVWDSGRGLPPSPGPATTLGMQVVELLTEQIHARLSIRAQGEGACFELRFATLPPASGEASQTGA